MKKGEVLEGRIERVIFPNKGVITTEEGKEVVVKNGIPGQKVRFSVSKIRSGRGEGRVLEVLEKADNELAAPACPHFGICGGCTYQNLSYENQLSLKENQVYELLKPVVQTEKKDWFEPAVASPDYDGYRNKMEFTFGNAVKDGPLTLGMHKRGSFHDIVPVVGCKIMDEDFSIILKATQEFFGEKEIPFFHRMRHTGYLRHLLVRRAVKTEEILVDLITTTQEIPGVVEKELLDAYKDMLLQLPIKGKYAGILHTKNDSVADVVVDEGTEILYGQSFFYEELLGLRFQISPFSFFQTNSKGAEVLYSTGREFIKESGDVEGKVVFDLYSGTGTIAQILAPVADQVVGVEIVEEAVEAAKKNAAENGIENCTFLAGDVLKVLDDIQEKPEFIVLDPPRDGIHPKALKKIIDYGVEKILYISCKPTSLARDLEPLQEAGYEVQRVRCVDMFPFTANMETVVLLSQQKPDDHIEIEINLDEIDATGAETKATYKKIQNWVQEKYGFHVTNLNIAQVKQKHGIIERENYNKPKTENSRQPGCTEEKVKAIEDALRHFQMI